MELPGLYIEYSPDICRLELNFGYKFGKNIYSHILIDEHIAIRDTRVDALANNRGTLANNDPCLF